MANFKTIFESVLSINSWLFQYSTPEPQERTGDKAIRDAASGDQNPTCPSVALEAQVFECISLLRFFTKLTALFCYVRTICERTREKSEEFIHDIFPTRQSCVSLLFKTLFFSQSTFNPIKGNKTHPPGLHDEPRSMHNALISPPRATFSTKPDESMKKHNTVSILPTQVPTL